MVNLTEEIVNARMAEPLEMELNRSVAFQDQKIKMQTAMNKWNCDVEMTKENFEAFNYIEESFSKYTYIYGKTAYRLGYSDGVQIGIELKTDTRKTILSLDDLTRLITIYDNVKKLNILLMGKFEIDRRKKGVLGTLDSIFDVINNGVCREIQMLGEEESFEKIICILDNSNSSPKERAKQLLGVE